MSQRKFQPIFHDFFVDLEVLRLIRQDVLQRMLKVGPKKCINAIQIKSSGKIRDEITLSIQIKTNVIF